MGFRVVWIGLVALLGASSGCGKSEAANQSAGGSDGQVNAAGGGEAAAPDDALPLGGAAAAGGAPALNAGGAGAPGVDDGAAGAASVATETEKFADSIAHAYCDKLFQCPGRQDDDVYEAIIFGSVARCTEQLALYLERDPSERDLRAKVKAGSIAFAPGAVQACLNEMRSCGFSERGQNPFSLGPKCRAVYVGSVPAGGACRRSEECADDARCVGDGGCEGTCAPRKSLGMPCESNRECDDRNAAVVCTIGPSSAQSTCRPLTHVVSAEAEPCTVIASAGQTEIRDCSEGLWCDAPPASSSGAGVCRARLAAGAACDDVLDFCPSGYACLAGSCQAPTVVREPGPGCGPELSAACDPFAHLICIDGECQLPGDGSAGSACGVTDLAGLIQCNSGLRCAAGAGFGSLGTCLPLLAEGETCERDADCESGTCDGRACAAFCALDR